jgi:hypothetical protein
MLPPYGNTAARSLAPLQFHFRVHLCVRRYQQLCDDVVAAGDWIAGYEWNGAASKEKMFQPCALGFSHDEQEINPRIIILH